MKYVQQIRGRWLVRMTVPSELRGIVGARELVDKDLPADPKARERAAHASINRFFVKLDRAREVYEAQQADPSLALQAAAKAHYARTLAVDIEKRSTMPTPEAVEAERQRALDTLLQEQRDKTQSEASIFNATTNFELMATAREDDIRNRTKRLAALRAGFASGDLRWVQPVVDAQVHAAGLDIQHGSAAWRQMADAFARAEIEALERTIERDRGDFSGKPSDPLLTAPDTQSAVAVTAGSQGRGATLNDALAGFHRERNAGSGSLAARTIEEHRNAVRMFNEFCGGEVLLSVITKKKVIDYKQALLQTPNRYTMRFPGLTLPEAIKANQKLPEPHATLAPKTINMKWLSHLSSVLQWASNNGHIESNPAQGVRVDTGAKSQQAASYLPFTREDLQKIFGHPIFANPSNYGTNQWALLVMLYTGVRNSSEMARMSLKNIYEEQGVPVFYLADASKNQRSKRLVPIHEDLVRLGFLKYVADLREAGATQLFPDWAKRTDRVNDWFNNTFLVSIGIKSKQKVFYSFRHTLATELARTGVPRELSKMISGHAPQEIASVYIQASPVTLMAEQLNRVKFDLPILAHFSARTEHSDPL